MSTSEARQPAEERVFAKVRRRVLPLLMLCYFFAFLDRVNVGFAALGMNEALGFSAAVYGAGAGIFFIGYFLFEVPSNLILERVGARRWIARIMITWGLISMAMAFVQGKGSFYTLRFLLGAAEAGFYPGVVLYLTYWFPVEERARVLGWFTVANPISTTIGAPISGFIVGHVSMAGLASWQWLFLIEGIPSVFLGIVIWLVLAESPSRARWLSAEERAIIERRVAADQAGRVHPGRMSLWQGLSNPLLLLFGAIYFGCIAGNYALSLWLPTIVKGFGVTALQTGLITALPYAFGAVAMVLWGIHSDRTGERKWHVGLPLLLVTASLLVSSQLNDPVWIMFFMCLAGIGIFANTPPFWTLPTSLMTGTAAAGGIALVNSLGNLSGFLAPYLMGWIKGTTGSFGIALAILACFPLLSAVLVLGLRRTR